MTNPYRVPLNWDMSKAPANKPCHVLLCDGVRAVPSVCFKTDQDGWVMQITNERVANFGLYVVAWCECAITQESAERAMAVYESKLSEEF